MVRRFVVRGTVSQLESSAFPNRLEVALLISALPGLALARPEKKSCDSIHSSVGVRRQQDRTLGYREVTEGLLAGHGEEGRY